MRNNHHWHYDKITRLLHGIIALLLIGLISMGWYMTSIEDLPNSGWYFDLHKSFGLIAAMLILLRLLWRLNHQTAPLPLSVPHWQAIASRSIHVLLYLCMVIMPLAGFFGASFSKYGVAFFGIELPRWVNQSQLISKQFFEVHWIVAWILTGLIILHVLAAMKHLLINKDSVFQRMIYFK